jgi:FkbM family methyltransferase
VWARTNELLKRAWPSGHAFLKQQLSGWRYAAPKRIRGEFFWVHPRLITTEAADHEPHIYHWILDHLPRRGVLFDVGAHYGWISLKAARHVGPDGKVIAFEASPVLIELLNYHQRRNRMSQMTVVSGAVSDADNGLADFYLLNEGLSSRNSLTIGRPGLPFLDNEFRTIARIPTRKLDTFCEESGLTPDVIKIDVEGAEGMVLRGAAETLRRSHPVLVVSIHPFWLPPDDSTKNILEWTDRFGYHEKDSRVMKFEGYEIGDYLLI